jgi:hypothetical protein
MPTQKTFKTRVRARMTKTGESYTTARNQLLRKAESASADQAAAESAPVLAETTDPVGTAGPADTAETEATSESAPSAATARSSAEATEMPSSDAAVTKATGRGYAEWFALLDAWGATSRSHTEIARWIRDDNETDGWWSQNVTVAYERARGMRAKHQMASGFSVGVSRTIKVDAETALAAFTDATVRQRWLPDAPMTRRRTTAANVARFDWADPTSRIVVSVDPKADRTTVWVSHEKLPDSATADLQKAAWRKRLSALKAVLEREA